MLLCLAKRNLQFSIRWENKRLFSANKLLQAAKQHGNLVKQSKIMTKLFGGRTSGSKKRWFPSNNVSISESKGLLTTASDIGKSARRNGKDASRRMTVLNKLFMSHITDLLATGEVSEQILGKGLQISRTKVSQDFTYINVYWLTTGDIKTDIELEADLKRCSGLLRHQLSQLDLMGRVPRIQFVKDKSYISMQKVETLLQNLDFGNDDEDEQSVEEYSNELERALFFGSEVSATPNIEENGMEIPKMRHDVFGLDHSAIMGRILAKMRKSQDAWNAYEHRAENDINQLEETTKSNNKHFAFDKENDAKLRAFMAERSRIESASKRKNTSHEKFRDFDTEVFSDDVDTVIMPSEQKTLYDAEDYLNEDINVDHEYEKHFK